MKFTHYLRKTILGGEVVRLPFLPEHYSAQGFRPLFAMPELEARRLVNTWNVSQSDNAQMYVFGLEE